MEKSIMKKIIHTEPGGGNGKVYDDILDVRGAKGSSRFVNHSQAFVENEVRELFNLKNKKQLTIEEFKKKHAGEFEDLFGTGGDEEMKEYRQMLDAARQEQLSRGKNHAELKDKFLKDKAKSARVLALEAQLARLAKERQRRLQQAMGLLSEDSDDSDGEGSKKKKKKKHSKEKRLPSEADGAADFKKQKIEAEDMDEKSEKFLLSKFQEEEESESSDHPDSEEDEQADSVTNWNHHWGVQGVQDTVQKGGNPQAAILGNGAGMMANAKQWKSAALNLRSAQLFLARTQQLRP